MGADERGDGAPGVVHRDDDDRDSPTVATATAPARGELTGLGVPTLPTNEILAREKPMAPGYDLLRVIGRGGMGVVWEALEHRFDRRVALKVHAAAAVGDGDLFAEALVAARIGDPGIVRVLDVGHTLDGQPFYAMEIVDGTDLAACLLEGPLPPRKAIGIAADVARAVAAAHEHGVIHRDLKPRNVIIDLTGRARVGDFGIAFNVNAGPDRYAGQLAGSPAYMAPEQALGLRILPQTDIFAIGVLLYEMLTQKRPFTAPTTEALLEAIALDDAPKPSSLVSNVHDDVDRVVARCLEKAPENRYPSARLLFETLSAIAEGRSIEGTHPRTIPVPKATPRKTPSSPPDRPRREDAKKHLSWSWRLSSSPSALWPHVANTDRFNRAVGLMPVTFTDEPNADGGAVRTGEARVMGMPIRWREFPFEWVKDREHSVFRWYRSGPIAALWNRVRLVPLEDGGTELHHDIWVTTRGMLGHVAAFVELDRKLGPAVDRFYRNLDAVLASGMAVDPFEPPRVPTDTDRKNVATRCAALERAGAAPTLVARLAELLLSAPDATAACLRPYALAAAWQAERNDVLDLFMLAAHHGLVVPAWDVVCPKCLMAHDSCSTLAHVTRVGTCKACASSFERDLRDSVELVFAPHPDVREVARLTYCAGAPALRPHVFCQQVLDPGEERRIVLDLPRGTYRVAGACATGTSEVAATAVGFEDTVEIVARDGRIETRPALVRAGMNTLVIRNESNAEETFRIEVPGAREDGVPATTAMTHPTFRELFADQLLATGEHVKASHIAFVFVELSRREGLFETHGDEVACAEQTRLEAIVQEEAARHEGSVVPSSLELLLLAFPNARQALEAALALRLRVDTAQLLAPVALAAHDGRCLALTRDGKAEFFGETIHRGKALLDECPAGGLALSASFSADRDVAVAIHGSPLRMTIAKAHRGGPYAGRRVTLLSPLGSAGPAPAPPTAQ